MARSAWQPSATRERVVLVVGLAVSGVVAGAALAPFTDPELAAQASFSRAAAETADVVLAEWQRMLSEPDDPVAKASLVIEGRRWPPDSVAARDLLRAREPGPNAFDALLAESERLEVRAGDLAAALAMVNDAISKTSDPTRLAQGHLRSLQLELRASRPVQAAAQWKWLRANLKPPDALGEVSVRLLALLAIGAALDGNVSLQDDFDLECTTLLDAWSSGTLALPTEKMVVLHQNGAEAGIESGVSIEKGGELRALAQRWSGLATLAQAQRVRVLANDQELAVLRRATYIEPEGVQADRSGAWELLPLSKQSTEDLVCWRPVATDRARVLCTRRSDLHLALAERVRRQRNLAPGFALDFVGSDQSLGPVVREATQLGELAGSFVLRHEDPKAAMAGLGARLGLLRAGLWAAALLSVLAAVSTWRAQRRERRLGQLRAAFVAGVSHELRTPVSSILLLAENLESGRVGSMGVEHYHRLIQREAQRLRRLIDDVLDVSRRERGKPLALRVESIELGPWAESLEQDAHAFAREQGLELLVHRQSTATSARIDGEALRRAVLNLLDNAKKHSGGPRVELSIVAAAGQLVLSVRDFGRGIPVGQKERIFEPFERMNGKVAGAGLGLAIVREIAQGHGGRACSVTVDSGAMIEVVVPLIAEESPVTRPQGESA